MSRHIRFNGRVRDLLEHITRRTRFLSLVSDLSFARVSFASFRTVTGELSTPSPQLPVASLSYLGAICTGEPVTDLISLFAPMLWFFFSLSFQAIATPATEHQLTQHQQRRGLGRDTCTTCLHVDSETTMMIDGPASGGDNERVRFVTVVRSIPPPPHHQLRLGRSRQHQGDQRPHLVPSFHHSHRTPLARGCFSFTPCLLPVTFSSFRSEFRSSKNKTKNLIAP